MEKYMQICSLSTDFPIRTLYLSEDNDYLLAVAKSGIGSPKALNFWPLEKNEDSFRINVSLKGIK